MPLIDLAKPEYDSIWRNEIFPQTFVTEEMTDDATADEKLRIAKRMREPGMFFQFLIAIAESTQ